MDSRITVRMSDEMIARIDAWIAAQSGYVSRQEAVRRFVEFSLEREDRFSIPGEEKVNQDIPESSMRGFAVPPA